MEIPIFNHELKSAMMETQITQIHVQIVVKMQNVGTDLSNQESKNVTMVT